MEKIGLHEARHTCASDEDRLMLARAGRNAAPAARRPVRCGGGGQAPPIPSPQAEAATSRTSLRTTVIPGIGLLPTPTVCAAASAFSPVSNSTSDVPLASPSGLSQYPAW